ncbi:MAG: glycosyltransferase [Chloroflexota bacterium]|nr:glycosyltransferase [Chloroflexota bacterium]
MSKMVPVSLVMTVRNEAATIGRLLESVSMQNVLPSEIVIADGGSTDGTQRIVTEMSRTMQMPIALIEQPGANISRGRNIAIDRAQYDIIAVTDAGVRLDADWLEKLVEPLLTSSDVDVSSGFFVADPQTAFETALGATILPAVEDVRPGTFLPSSRSVAFRKSAWRAVDGYPEWLDYCEDLVFDQDLKKKGFCFVFTPGARARFRPRSSLRTFYLQYFLYARGDGKADLWRKRHAARYATYILGPSVILWALLHRCTTAGKIALVLSGLAASGYCRRPWLRLLPQLRTTTFPQALFAVAMVPLIRLTGDVAKMSGYPVGVIWRIRSCKRIGCTDVPC